MSDQDTSYHNIKWLQTSYSCLLDSFYRRFCCRVCPLLLLFALQYTSTSSSLLLSSCIIDWEEWACVVDWDEIGAGVGAVAAWWVCGAGVSLYSREGLRSMISSRAVIAASTWPNNNNHNNVNNNHNRKEEKKEGMKWEKRVQFDASSKSIQWVDVRVMRVDKYVICR